MQKRSSAGKADYNWQSNCSFELLVDGTCYFPRILDAITQAKHAIDIEMYLVVSGKATARLVDALVAAADAGVIIRCLFDATGSLECRSEETDRIRDAGIELRHYNPMSWRLGSESLRRNLHRNHRKLLVFDGTTVFIGGTGFTDDFCEAIAETGETRWHEQMLVVQGPVVADWQDLFEESWKQANEKARFRIPRARRRNTISNWPQPGNNQGRVSYSDSLFHRGLMSSLLGSIRRAKIRVWIATPYFLPSRALRRALSQAARRGVDVRLQLSGEQIDLPAVRFAGQRYYPRLLRAGVRILEYEPRFAHLKTVLVDQWVSIGSCNFDHWTLYWNKEANQDAIDDALAQAVQESFERDFSQSREWTMTRWRALPLMHRLKIRLWGAVNRLVMVCFNIKY